MSSSVEDWLRSLGFIHYTQAFLDNGYDELEICKEIGKEDLDAIGVKNFKDRTDILNAVQRLKQSGTAVYFVLEAEGGQSSEPLQSQPERETYTPVSLKMMLLDKLLEDKIDLTCAPYSCEDGSEGSLETLVTIYADKFYTYEDDVLTALRSLRHRRVEKEGTFEDPSSQIPAPHAPQRARRSSKYNSRSSEERDNEEGHEAVSEDEFQHKSISSEGQTSPTRVAMNPADYLDVDSPAQRGKKSKKRRKVERNTKLSRSLDSLKELHVNVEPKPRDRESSSLKSKPFKWLYGSKKKNHNNKIKKQQVEKKLSNPSSKQDYEMLASAIQMSEEDRMALMIMVKQGELTVEEAVEQLKRYEEDFKKDDFLKPKGDVSSHDDDKAESKPKLKRGLFGKSSKRKPNSRPSSEFIACEMTTMSEEDRINLMRSVKAGDLSVDQALKRFISYEEKHKKSDSDDVPVKESPKLSKGTGFSRISIKRVSGVISSSFRLPSVSNDQPNSVFYTEDGASADGSVSSGDEVLGVNDSSPAPSPKRLLANIQDLNKSQHSSTSSVDSVEKVDEKPTLSSVPPHRQPNFLSEMKVVLGKQPTGTKCRDGEEDALQSNQRLINNTSNKNARPRPPPPDRKPSLPLMETQKVVLPPNPSGSLKRVPPDAQSRHQSSVVAPHRRPPPIPTRPSPKVTGDQQKPQSFSVESEATKSDSARLKGDESRNAVAQTSASNSDEREAYLEPVEVQAAVIPRPRNKPPPLPPRPTSTSSLNEEHDISEARSVETQTSPQSPTTTQLDKSSETAASTEEIYKTPPKPEPINKPQLKPKPKPRPRPKRTLTPDKLDEPYTEVPPPRPVLRGSAGNTRTHGETSRDESETDVDRGESKSSNVKRTEPSASQNGREEDSNLKPSPVPAPRIKRQSHSIGEMIERKLQIEKIDLTKEPYTDRDGCWGVPVNLVDRYAEELHRPHEEIAGILERIRVRKLQEADKQVVHCNVSELDFTRDTLGRLGTLKEWLTSLGLPMYEDSLTEVEYDNMEEMPYMGERHFQYAGITDPRHMRRLLASVEQMVG